MTTIATRPRRGRRDERSGITASARAAALRETHDTPTADGERLLEPRRTSGHRQDDELEIGDAGGAQRALRRPIDVIDDGAAGVGCQQAIGRTVNTEIDTMTVRRGRDLLHEQRRPLELDGSAAEDRAPACGSLSASRSSSCDSSDCAGGPGALAVWRRGQRHPARRRRQRHHRRWTRSGRGRRRRRQRHDSRPRRSP